MDSLYEPPLDKSKDQIRLLYLSRGDLQTLATAEPMKNGGDNRTRVKM